MASQQLPPDTKNWKLIHDPLLRKGLQKLYRYDGYVSGHSPYNVSQPSDPRSLSTKLFSRNEIADLTVPTFIIDENYVGRPPQRELAFFDLNDNVNENFLTDLCKKCGALEEVKVFYHPTTKRHSGIARVVYRTEKEAMVCLEKYNGTSVMGKLVKVVADPRGKLVNESFDELLNKNKNSTIDRDNSKISISDGATEPVNQTVSTSSSVAAPNHASTASDNLANHSFQSAFMPNIPTSSPTVCVPPTPGIGSIPEDPTSYPHPVSYNCVHSFPPAGYPIPTTWYPVVPETSYPTNGFHPMPAFFAVAPDVTSVPPLPNYCMPPLPPTVVTKKSTTGHSSGRESRQSSTADLKKRPSSSAAKHNDISAPFGKLERISGSSDGETSQDERRHNKSRKKALKLTRRFSRQDDEKQHRSHVKTENSTARHSSGKHGRRSSVSADKKRRPSSSISGYNDISLPFGKLERISCTSEDTSEDERRREKSRSREKSSKFAKRHNRHGDEKRRHSRHVTEHFSNGRSSRNHSRLSSSSDSKRRRDRPRGEKLRRSTHDRSSSSGSSQSSSSTAASSSSTRDHGRRQHRYRSKKCNDQKNHTAFIKETLNEYNHEITPNHVGNGITTTEKISAAAADVHDSLESRIQQLLSGELLHNGNALEENCSTPVQDEHNSSSLSLPTKAEKSSDVEMSLSSGDDDHGRHTPDAKHKEPESAAGSVNYGTPMMVPANSYYYPPVFVYPAAPPFPACPPPAMVPLPAPPPPHYAWIPPYHQQPPNPAPRPRLIRPLGPKTNLFERRRPVNEKDHKHLADASIAGVRCALKEVLHKDIVKRTMETLLFQSTDNWFVEKETAHKTSVSKNETNNPLAQVQYSATSSSFGTQQPLTNIFDARPSSDISSLFTGIPGLGLRASLPKLPSFKKKVLQPPTPPPLTPCREDESEDSEAAVEDDQVSEVNQSETSEAEDEDDQISEESKDSIDDVAVSKRRFSRRPRLRTDSSDSADSRKSERKSVIEENGLATNVEPTKPRLIETDDSGENSQRALTDLDQSTDDKRMEPISDEEIDDELENDIDAKSDSSEELSETENVTAEPVAMDESEKIDTDKEDENGNDSQIDEGVAESRCPLLEKENIIDLASPMSDSASSVGQRISGGKKRRAPNRVETTTEDEVSGQEDAAVSSIVPVPSWIPQASTENELIEMQKIPVDRPDGAMFVEDGCQYRPHEFDHFYTLRLGQTPIYTSSPATYNATALDKKTAAEIAIGKKTKTVEAHVKPPKPRRPAVTFKSRSALDERQILDQFVRSGIDEEDIGYMKAIFDNFTSTGHIISSYIRWSHHVATMEPPYKRRRLLPDEIPAHSTGCARTQGFYRLSHKEKRRISKPRQALEYTDAQNQQIVNVAKQQLQFNREARSMQRRLLTTLGSDVDSDLLKYNHLKFRKKLIKFSRSSIHGWGLFAMEDILQDEMIVEYVGQKVRITVAEKREKKYEKMGVGSSYLFRIDNDMVVDATKRGNIARFINHSCNPNCYAKIITVEGEKRIVIYSKQNISRGEEITYDYKFPLEDEKIPCTCGASCCRGTLN